MTAAEPERSPLPNAKDVDLRAAEWLERRHREEWNETDRIALDAWFAASSAHRLAYLRVEAAWDRAHRLSALRRPQRDEGLLAAASRLTRFTKIAAAIAILSAAGAGIAEYVKSPAARVYVTAIGGHKTISLADGSKVELNTDSVLRVAFDAGQRTMWL
jgi:transmembrane sensor